MSILLHLAPFESVVANAATLNLLWILCLLAYDLLVCHQPQLASESYANFGCASDSSLRKYNFLYIWCLLNLSLAIWQHYCIGCFSKSITVTSDWILIPMWFLGVFLVQLHTDIIGRRILNVLSWSADSECVVTSVATFSIGCFSKSRL